MKIFNKIKQAKNKAMAYRESVEQKKVIRTAESLKDLKRQRLAKEGRVKIYEQRDIEQNKLNKTNQNLRKRTPAYRVADAIRRKVQENKKSGRGFGNSSIGGNFAQNSGSGQIGNFTIGQNNKPKSKPKQKGRSITIKY